MCTALNPVHFHYCHGLIEALLSKDLNEFHPHIFRGIAAAASLKPYKDVTFETLNKPDFLSLIQKAFPAVNWDKAYEEFRAAGEKTG
jgi:hypothetical protein